MEDKVFIQSKRLYVRAWNRNDLDAFHLVMSDPQTYDLLPGKSNLTSGISFEGSNCLLAIPVLAENFFM